MKRRQVPSSSRVPAPPWLQVTTRGLKHFGAAQADGHLAVGEATRVARHRLEQARDEWCREKGCWRPGTKTCEEAGLPPCDARRAAE